MITSILNQLLKNPNTIFKIYSSCPLLPLNFRGTIKNFEEISKSGEILINFLNIQTGKIILIGTNHPHLTITWED